MKVKRLSRAGGNPDGSGEDLDSRLRGKDETGGFGLFDGMPSGQAVMCVRYFPWPESF
jgi:hypothetical protein